MWARPCPTRKTSAGRTSGGKTAARIPGHRRVLTGGIGGIDWLLTVGAAGCLRERGRRWPPCPQLVDGRLGGLLGSRFRLSRRRSRTRLAPLILVGAGRRARCCLLRSPRSIGRRAAWRRGCDACGLPAEGARPRAALGIALAAGGARSQRHDRPGRLHRRPQRTFSLAADERSDRRWQRFANGASKATPYGLDTVIVDRAKTEQFSRSPSVKVRKRGDGRSTRQTSRRD
jgi:hypothetical protein